MELLRLICFIITIAGCFIVLSYSGMASKRGWATGTMFVSGSLFTIISGILLLAAIILSFTYFIWWKAILVVIGSWLAAGMLTSLLRSTSQFTALALIAAGVILYIISFSSIG